MNSIHRDYSLFFNLCKMKLNWVIVCTFNHMTLICLWQIVALWVFKPAIKPFKLMFHFISFIYRPKNATQQNVRCFGGEASIVRDRYGSRLWSSTALHRELILCAQWFWALAPEYRGGQKWAYIRAYVKHRVYSCVIIYYLLCQFPCEQL